MVRPRLSYANVVSTLALFVAVAGGGAAFAAVAKNSVGSGQIRNGAVKTVDLGAGAVTSGKVRKNAMTGADVDESRLGPVPRADNVLAATVHANGDLVPSRSPHAVSATPLIAGVTSVTFDRDISRCSAAVSLGGAATGDGPTMGLAGSAYPVGAPRAVVVHTQTPAGEPLAAAFRVLVVC